MLKYIILAAVVIGLSSCNTFLGLGKDTSNAYHWTKDKIQGN